MEHPKRTLSDPHRAMLVTSSIAEAVITARGYFTATDKATLAALGFRAYQQRPPALVLPLYSPHGTCVGYQIRPDRPRIRRAQNGTEHVLKYENPTGATMTADTPPVPWNLQTLRDPKVPLWITEGVKKGDALVTHGACAVALLGVWNFRGTNSDGGKTVLADFDAIAFNDHRRVYVVYDNDIMEKKEVAQGLERLVRLLERRGAEVWPVYLPAGPEKLGIDDYFAQGHTLEEAQKLAEPQLRPERMPPVTMTGQEDRWRANLLLDSRGHPKDVFGNVMEILTYHPHWKDTLAWDTLQAAPRWHGQLVTDETIAAMAHWLMVQLAMPANRLQLLRRAVEAVAQQHPVDPLQDWLARLPPWDGTPRLDHWLIRYAGADESDYARFVGQMVFGGMITRALNPGCIMRSVVILEGAENTGKSTLVAELGRPWHAQLFAGLDAKEAQMRLRGVWVMELPELDALSRAEETRIKAFISATHDTYVPKYSNDTVSYPRRTVFLGTTNEETYLKGTTGNTRFLPIRTGIIDLEGFVTVREQLCAEALQYVEHHPVWWEESEDLREQIQEERDARRSVNEYEAPLATWLRDSYITSVSWPEIAKDFLKIEAPEKWKDKALQMQISQALKALRWERRLKREGEIVERRWYPHASGSLDNVPF